MKNLSYIILGVFIMLGSFQAVSADQIVLKNGDRITGKIVKKETDKVTIETEFAGIITVLANNIEKVIEETKDVQIIKAKADIEQKETEVEKTENENPSTETSGENKKSSVFSNSKKRAFGLTSGWDGAANVGFSFTSGNTKTALVTAGIRAEKSGDKDKWTTYLNALWNRNRVGGLNVTTSNGFAQ